MKGKKKQEFLTRQNQLAAAIKQVEKFLYQFQPSILTSNYRGLVQEVVKSLKDHSWREMRGVLSKLLTRSDVEQLLVSTAHELKPDNAIGKDGIKFQVIGEKEWDD